MTQQKGELNSYLAITRDETETVSYYMALEKALSAILLFKLWPSLSPWLITVVN